MQGWLVRWIIGFFITEVVSHIQSQPGHKKPFWLNVRSHKGDWSRGKPTLFRGCHAEAAGGPSSSTNCWGNMRDLWPWTSTVWTPPLRCCPGIRNQNLRQASRAISLALTYIAAILANLGWGLLWGVGFYLTKSISRLLTKGIGFCKFGIKQRWQFGHTKVFLIFFFFNVGIFIACHHGFPLREDGVTICENDLVRNLASVLSCLLVLWTSVFD